MAVTDTLSRLLLGLADALDTVGAAVSTEEGFEEVVVSLGWDVAARPALITDLGTAAQELAAARRALFGEESPSPLQLDRLRVAIGAMISGLEQLSTATFPPPLAGSSFALQFGRAVVDHAVIDHLYREHRLALHILRVLGVVRFRWVEATADRRAYVAREILWDNLPRLLGGPAEAYREAYGWGTAEFDGEELLSAVQDLLCSLRWPAALEPMPRALLDALSGRVDPAAAPDLAVNLRLLENAFPGVESTAGLRLLSLPLAPGRLPSLAILPFLSATLAERFPVDEHFDIEVKSDLDLQGGVGLRLTPEQGLELVLGLSDPENATVGAGSITAAIDVHDPTKSEKVLFGSEGGTRLVVTTVVGRAGAKVDTLGGRDLFVEVELKDARLELAGAEQDGFVASNLPPDAAASFALAAGLSTARGAYLRGSATLATRIPLSIAIGPVRISGLGVTLTPVAGGAHLRVDTEIGGKIGPVTFLIDGVGLEARAARPTGGGGALDASLVPAAPRGVGLSIDAGLVKGGGYLRHDAAAGRYEGALALDALGVAVKALGVLDTRPPTGAWSLVAAISAAFSPIPLGLGFTLEGVGGLIGIHRRVDTEALRAALRGPGIGDIFFGADPATQASRVLTDLARYFPAAPGRHVFGPAAKLGWGTPTIVEATVALLLEVPAPVRLVLLGHAAIALPTKDAPVLELNVDVLGELDLARKTLAIDATLRDSQVAGFPITGDLALRMGWGDPPSFVLSVGGFHSQFRPPPGFPELRRVHIPIGSGENPRLDITGFLALTSNTAQIGAAVDLYAAAGPLNVVGNLGFEALIQFVPFGFEVDLWAGVALRRGTRVLAGVHLDGKLRGPSPWRFSGEACLSLWFIDLCVGFDATFGQERAVALPTREIWPALEEALEDHRNWGSTMPASGARAVTTAPPRDELPATPGESAATRIDPVATLSVQQKVVPLNRTIERYAQVAPQGPNRFDVTAARLGASALTPALAGGLVRARAVRGPDRRREAGAARLREDGGRGVAGGRRGGHRRADAGEAVGLRDDQVPGPGAPGGAVPAGPRPAARRDRHRVQWAGPAAPAAGGDAAGDAGGGDLRDRLRARSDPAPRSGAAGRPHERRAGLESVPGQPPREPRRPAGRAAP
jgi:hypothetical protein